MISQDQLRNLLGELQDYNISMADLLLSFFQSRDAMADAAAVEVSMSIETLLDSMARHPRMRDAVETQSKNGMRFNARHATASQLEQFDIGGLANTMLATAPRLWNLMRQLMESDAEIAQRRKRRAWKRRPPVNAQAISSRANDGPASADLGEVPNAMPAAELAADVQEDATVTEITEDSEHEYWVDDGSWANELDWETSEPTPPLADVPHARRPGRR